MRDKSYKWAGIALIGIFSLAIFKFAPNIQVQAQTNPAACPTGLTTNITSGAVLSGVTPVNLGMPTVNTSFTINRVIYRLDGRIIGQARQTTTGTNSWSMMWATQLADPGPHSLNAFITYNLTAVCQTAPIGINVSPATVTSVLGLDVNPPSWSGSTNQTVDFMATPNANVPIPQTELAQYVVYEWNTNIGTLALTHSAARFNSGGTAGTGRVYVKAMYGGKEAIREMPVQIQSQNEPVGTTPPPSTTSTTTTTATTTQNTTSTTPTGTTTTESAPVAPLTAEQKIALISTQLTAQPEILSCANLNLTSARMDELRLSGRRLDRQEFERIRGCFSQLNYVVPSPYAPVAPDEIRTDTVKPTQVARINNATTEEPATPDKPKTLRFQGQAKPDSDVLVYVFSEPLVLYAKADGDGNWVYDLVDPLEPGSHEAYAVVEDADGTYKKSSAFSFLIQTAQASADNPNGYSLSVENVASLNPPASERGLSFYIIASGMIVIFVMGVGGYILNKTFHHIPSDDSSGPKGYGA